MKAIYSARVHLKISEIVKSLKMSKNTNKVYYAVARGRETGIYDSWRECKDQIGGISNAKFRKFSSLKEAEEFINIYKNCSSPSKNYTINPDEMVKDDSEHSTDCEDDVCLESKSLNTTDKSTSLPPSTNLASVEALQNDVNSLALNLRLDSFEKRFDACLKEVGGIISEISLIKSEIKEMKKVLAPDSDSPLKSSSLRQSILNFGNHSTPKKSCSVNSSGSSRPYSTKINVENYNEPGIKKMKSLKRKTDFESPEKYKDSDSGEEVSIKKFKTAKVDYSSFTVDEDDFIEVYTDGACHSNGKTCAKAGIGIWFGDDHPLNVSEPVEGSASNNSAEIQAARVAVELAVKAGISRLKIITDSEFLINCITKWIHRWKKNGWKTSEGNPVKNKTELEKLDKVASKLKVRWEKVEGHAGIKGNEMADQLAKKGAEKYGE